MCNVRTADFFVFFVFLAVLIPPLRPEILAGKCLGTIVLFVLRKGSKGVTDLRRVSIVHILLLFNWNVLDR